MKTRNHKAIYPRVLALALFFGMAGAGCASAPSTSMKPGKPGEAPQARAKLYLEGYSVAVAHETFGSGCSPAKSKLDWKELVARASSCAAKKDWTTLDLLANDLAKNNADSPWGPYYLSIAAEGRGDWPRAMWMIDLATKKAGPQGLFSYQRGRVWMLTGDTAQGLAEIQKAVSLEPRLIEGHLYLGEIFARDLENSKAASHFKAVLAAQPGHRRAQAGLAEVRLHDGADAEATALYQELKGAMDSGEIKEKNDPELVAKIKYLGTTVKPVQALQPAPAKADKAPASVGVKGSGK